MGCETRVHEMFGLVLFICLGKQNQHAIARCTLLFSMQFSCIDFFAVRWRGGLFKMAKEQILLLSLLFFFFFFFNE